MNGVCCFVFAFEKIDFENDDTAGDTGARNVFNDLFSSDKSATSCNQIVDKKSFRARWEGIFLNLDRVFTVLKTVALLPAFSWKLALLANRNEGQTPRQS